MPSLSEQVASLGPWFHNLHLPDGTQTAPDHELGDFPARVWQELAPALPQDLSGWQALDVGCNAGFYSFELAKRGALVTGIDHHEHYLKQARWAAPFFDLEDRVRWLHANVYELPDFDPYDLVLFMGTLYHLRYPMLGLDFVTRRTKRLLVFQTLTMPGPVPSAKDGVAVDAPINQRQHMLEAGFPKMAFIERRFAGDATNWWVPNPACVEAILRSSGFRVSRRINEELCICEPAPGLAGQGQVIESVRLREMIRQ